MEINENNSNDEKKPMGIIILSIIFLLGVPFNLLNIFGEPQAVLFGIALNSDYSKIFYLTSAIIGVVLAYGFFKLKKQAWLLGMFIIAFGAFNVLFSAVIIGETIFSLIISLIIFSVILIILVYLNGKYENFNN